MSVFTEARVALFMTDFANADPQGKFNVIGGGFNLIGRDPASGATAPFSLLVFVQVPTRYAGTNYALTVELHNVTTGQIVQVPGGPGGQLQPLRAQQAVPVQAMQVPPQFSAPTDSYSGNIIVMNFADGIPLADGSSYEWRVEIDGQSRHWASRFHVLGPAPGLVFGGPTGPASIPGVQYVVDHPDDDTPDRPPPEGPQS